MRTVLNSRDLFCSVIISIAFSVSSDQRRIDADTETEEFNSCSPAAHPEKPQYIIGYGSLLLEASKKKTYPNAGENIPVTVKGFSRRWNAQAGSVGLGPTYLGVVETPNFGFNAIVFQLHSENISSTLKGFDIREEWYCRHRVPFKQLDFRAWNKNVSAELEDGEYWMYINKPQFTEKPSREYPIVQSYVDIFISGCLEMEQKHGLKDYARQCVESTHGWSFSWVNDRIYPRRPFVYVKNADVIDRLLASVVPKQFGRIKVE